jgi:hypothetical protein
MPAGLESRFGIAYPAQIRSDLVAFTKKVGINPVEKYGSLDYFRTA